MEPIRVVQLLTPNTKIGEIARFRVFRCDDQRHGKRSAALGLAMISRPVVLTYLFQDYKSFWTRVFYDTNDLFNLPFIFYHILMVIIWGICHSGCIQEERSKTTRLKKESKNSSAFQLLFFVLPLLLAALSVSFHLLEQRVMSLILELLVPALVILDIGHIITTSQTTKSGSAAFSTAFLRCHSLAGAHREQIIIDLFDVGG